jgi:hypothetical protein
MPVCREYHQLHRKEAFILSCSAKTKMITSACRTILSFVAPAVLILSIADCRVHRYSNAELLKHEAFVFPAVYDTIIQPLHEQTIPISKRIFFLKNDVSEFKERLWDGGSNQRVMKIDNRIDTLNHEIFVLSSIRREIINSIIFIYPTYQPPQIVPYTGKDKTYETFTKPIILITSEDQHEYEQAKSTGEKMSEELDYKPLLATAMRQYSKLPDSLKRPIQPLGTPGVAPIPPYTPPPLPRKRVKVTSY